VPAEEPLEVDESVFDDVIREVKVPVLVDFWAPWCGPCRSAASQVHDLAREMAGRAVVLKVNTDANQQLAERYRIQSIPNFVVFRHGKPVMQRVGLAPRSEMRRWLEASTAPSGIRLEP